MRQMISCFAGLHCRRGQHSWPAWVALLLAVLIVSGCGGNGRRAPIEERAGPDQQYARIYTVLAGDTMYSIAFRYGLDYRRLGAANGLGSPYTIYPGQRLYLREADVPKPAVTATRRSAPSAGSAAPTSARTPAAATAKTSRSSAPARKDTASNTASNPSEPDWQWPASGPVSRGYSATVHKGIDIGGESGDPVYAAAAGKVVYAGTGIVGFGELIIVKHNDRYLSAYGHNRRLLVAEGSAVKAGQKIALKGNTGTDKVKLHFEIRRAGKPIDPLQRLPRR